MSIKYNIQSQFNEFECCTVVYERDEYIQFYINFFNTIVGVISIH